MRRTVWLLVFVVVLVGLPAAVEFPNYLRKPSLRTLAFVDVGCRIDLFSDGVRPRETAMVLRSSGKEILLDVIGGEGLSRGGEQFGGLRRTADGGALVATGRRGGLAEPQGTLWVFDVVGMRWVSEPEEEVAIAERGGLGEEVFSWLDLGRRGGYLFTWQANRWRELIGMLKADEGSSGSELW